MNLLDDNQSRRYLYLKQLYDKGADEYHPFSILEIGRELGWEDKITDDVENWLEAEGLVCYPSFGQIYISHRGQVKVEERLVEYSRPSTTLNASPSPFLSGIFYLITMIVSVLLSLVVFLTTRNLFATGFILFSALLTFLIIGIFQLKNEKSLSEKSFVQLIEIIIKQIPLLLKGKSTK